MTLDSMLNPGFLQMLRMLSGLLDKAEAAGADGDALLRQRLAPDMFPLATQIRFACFQAQEPWYRLRGLDIPDALDAVRREGVAAAEAPGTIAEARACVQAAIANLAGRDSDGVTVDPEGPVLLALPNGMTFALTAAQYARDWALPQFYFHLNTAYALIRLHGIPLGKADYVPHMFAYLQPPRPTEG